MIKEFEQQAKLQAEYDDATARLLRHKTAQLKQMRDEEEQFEEEKAEQLKFVADTRDGKTSPRAGKSEKKESGTERPI